MRAFALLVLLGMLLGVPARAQAASAQRPLVYDLLWHVHQFVDPCAQSAADLAYGLTWGDLSNAGQTYTDCAQSIRRMRYLYGCDGSVASYLPAGLAGLPDALAFVRDWCMAIDDYFTASKESGLDSWQPDQATALFKAAAGVIHAANGHEHRLREAFER